MQELPNITPRSSVEELGGSFLFLRAPLESHFWGKIWILDIKTESIQLKIIFFSQWPHNRTSGLIAALALTTRWTVLLWWRLAPTIKLSFKEQKDVLKKNGSSCAMWKRSIWPTEGSTEGLFKRWRDVFCRVWTSFVFHLSLANSKERLDMVTVKCCYPLMAFVFSSIDFFLLQELRIYVWLAPLFLCKKKSNWPARRNESQAHPRSR